MAKKQRSPNQALIDALKPEPILPYDPELLQAWGEDFRRAWNQLIQLRQEVYRRVMPNIWMEVLEAERADDWELAKAIDLRADCEWSEAMGVPALTSFENLEIIRARIQADGYPPTDAGLHAWVIARLSSTKAPRIPTQYRTRALSKQKAAELLRGGNPDSAVEWLNQCITDGTISCETLSRQSHVFDVRQFPEGAQSRILPN